MLKASVVMPCFNHAAYIGASIEAILEQTVSDLELIVVDDCSQDASPAIVAEYINRDPRIRLVQHRKNLGASKARNAGMKLARGEFVAFCDADDVWSPVKLERQIKSLQEHPDCKVAYCDARIIDERGVETGERFSNRFPVPGDGSGSLFGELCTRNFINMQTAILRRECIEEAGFFDEHIKYVEDWCFWIDVSRGRRFHYANDVLASYREHSTSTALVHRRGYMQNRIKAFHRTLRLYPWIPSQLKADIYYHIGSAFSGLKRPKFARGCYFRSLKLHKLNPRALGRLLFSYIYQ